MHLNFKEIKTQIENTLINECLKHTFDPPYETVLQSSTMRNIAREQNLQVRNPTWDEIEFWSRWPRVNLLDKKPTFL